MASGQRSTAELIASIERGVYVTRLHYVSPTNLAELELTGVTRDGTFLIQEGQLRAPLCDLRFNQSLLQALRGEVEPGSETRLLASDFYGAFCVPALRLGSWHFGM